MARRCGPRGARSAELVAGAEWQVRALLPSPSRRLIAGERPRYWWLDKDLKIKSQGMDEPSRFELLLADLSTRFTGAPAEQLDGEIDGALAALAEFLDTDRASFAELLPEPGVVLVTHSWARAGVAAVERSMPLSGRFVWYHDRLRKGEALLFNRLPDDFPAHARAEREYAAALPMLSHVVVPLSVGGRWVCALGTATATTYRSWTNMDVARIRSVGQILANAIHRRAVESELRESLTEVRRLQEHLSAENDYLREELESEASFEQIVGRSPALRAVLAQAAQVAPTSATVLLLGDTGTGKELLARAIHARSKRSERALIKVNCAAIPQTLVESELFGHEKGAFTGATASRQGRFELADEGTLFLDEVGELPLEVQAKLLRVLEEGEFERLGSNRTHKVDVRILAATNRNLEQAIDAGRFRKDLFYRLSAFPIRLPPLRDRREDIPLLVWARIEQRQAELGRRIDRVPERVMQALTRYLWPGNIRELGNVIERALILSPASSLCLDESFAALAPRPEEPGEHLADAERAHLLQILDRCAWKIDGPGNGAERLGMRPSTLRARLRKLGIVRPQSPRTA